MKLINFKSFLPMKQLREKMGIKEDYIPNFNSSKALIKEMKWEEIKSRGLDIEIKELEISEDGTLEHKDFVGQKMIVYIRDYRAEYSKPKFHISWCKTLSEMSERGRYSRYVVSQRKDGFFSLNKMVNGAVVESNIEEKLEVCKYCLGRLNYKGYNKIYGDEKKKIYEEFNVVEFLKIYNTEIHLKPEHKDKTQPLNEYSKDWEQVSYNYRKLKKFICNDCGVDCSKNTGNLHVHHIDGNKFNNNPSNLEAVCYKCHSEKPMHEHMKKNKEFR